MSSTFCQVCNISFCGEIPAQQHYQGKKHAKKLKVFNFEEENKVVEVMPTKVGLNLDYCELCEMKLSQGLAFFEFFKNSYLDNFQNIEHFNKTCIHHFKLIV